MRTELAFAAIGALAIVALLAFAGGAYVTHVAILSFLFAALATAWNVSVGFTGVKSFGHQAFYAVGAYASALLCMHWGLSPWLGLLAGGAVAALTGVALGAPTLRLKSTAHVAIATLAFAEIIRIVISNAVPLTRGVLGLSGVPPLPSLTIPGVGSLNFQQLDNTGYLVASAVLFLLVFCAAAIVVRGPAGLALQAVRDGEAAAESLGIDLAKVKISVFVGTAFATGVCGAFYAHYIGVLTPDAVGAPDVMVAIMAITLVGGMGTLVGPVIGAFALVGLGEALRAFGNYQLLVYGGLIVATTLLAPGGLAPAAARFWRARTQRAAPPAADAPPGGRGRLADA
ncbi:MAG: hypothetical protein BGP06_14100 [Rhizobiales bacterium 65-9]|nr:branched-chain amino acid ABC transporter permease [Hyphomicrobiales bacterium]OJY36809.1 MAG: hypothetical protein BGP06_14100 [Rhizobiales bacterium 65-9]